MKANLTDSKAKRFLSLMIESLLLTMICRYGPEIVILVTFRWRLISFRYLIPFTNNFTLVSFALESLFKLSRGDGTAAYTQCTAAYAQCTAAYTCGTAAYMVNVRIKLPQSS